MPKSSKDEDDKKYRVETKKGGHTKWVGSKETAEEQMENVEGRGQEGKIVSGEKKSGVTYDTEITSVGGSSGSSSSGTSSGGGSGGGSSSSSDSKAKYYLKKEKGKKKWSWILTNKPDYWKERGEVKGGYSSKEKARKGVEELNKEEEDREKEAKAIREEGKAERKKTKEYETSHVMDIEGKQVPVAKVKKGEFLYEGPKGKTKKVKTSGTYARQKAAGKIAEEYGTRLQATGGMMKTGRQYRSYSRAKQQKKLMSKEKPVYIGRKGGEVKLSYDKGELDQAVKLKEKDIKRERTDKGVQVKLKEKATRKYMVPVTRPKFAEEGQLSPTETQYYYEKHGKVPVKMERPGEKVMVETPEGKARELSKLLEEERKEERKKKKKERGILETAGAILTPRTVGAFEKTGGPQLVKRTMTEEQMKQEKERQAQIKENLETQRKFFGDIGIEEKGGYSERAKKLAKESEPRSFERGVQAAGATASLVGSALARGVVKAPEGLIQTPEFAARAVGEPQRVASQVVSQITRKPVVFTGEMAGTMAVTYGISKGIGAGARGAPKAAGKAGRAVGRGARYVRRRIPKTTRFKPKLKSTTKKFRIRPKETSVKNLETTEISKTKAVTEGDVYFRAPEGWIKGRVGIITKVKKPGTVQETPYHIVKAETPRQKVGRTTYQPKELKFSLKGKKETPRQSYDLGSKGAREYAKENVEGIIERRMYKGYGRFGKPRELTYAEQRALAMEPEVTKVGIRGASGLRGGTYRPYKVAQVIRRAEKGVSPVRRGGKRLYKYETEGTREATRALTDVKLKGKAPKPKPKPKVYQKGRYPNPARELRIQRPLRAPRITKGAGRGLVRKPATAFQKARGALPKYLGAQAAAVSGPALKKRKRQDVMKEWARAAKGMTPKQMLERTYPKQKLPKPLTETAPVQKKRRKTTTSKKLQPKTTQKTTTTTIGRALASPPPIIVSPPSGFGFPVIDKPRRRRVFKPGKMPAKYRLEWLRRRFRKPEDLL